jgi:hypothetical protein
VEVILDGYLHIPGGYPVKIPPRPPERPLAAPAPAAMPGLVFAPHPLLPATRTLHESVVLPGESLHAYLTRLLPDVPVGDARIHWLAAIGDKRVPRALWAKTFPKPGQIITLTISLRGGGGGGGGGKNPLQTVLSIGLMLVAPAVGGSLATTIFGEGAKFALFGQSVSWSSVFSGLVGAAGRMLISRLASPPQPNLSQASGAGGGAAAAVSPTYSLSGGANRARPYEPLPLVMGRHRIFPDFGARFYSEFEGEDQFGYYVFNFGLSDLVLSDYRIGTTPIDNYQDVQIEESGVDGALKSFPGNVDSVAGAALTVALGAITRTSSISATALAVDLQASLYEIGGGAPAANTVVLKIEYRLAGAGGWTDLAYSTDTAPADYASTLGTCYIKDTDAGAGQVSITNATQKPVRRSFKWNVAPGQYEVRVTRITADSTSASSISETAWSTLKTYQPDTADYTGQKRVGIKIKASGQLQGQLDQFSAIASAKCEAWNGAAWVLQETSNPAWWARWFAKGKLIGGKRAFGCDLADAEIDGDAWKAFGTWCDTKALTFNAVFDQARVAGEMLSMIVRCGRGRITWANGKLGVVWDAGGQPVVAQFGMANIIRDSFQVQYVSDETPEEVIVKYINPDKDWAQDEVRCKVPGVTTPATSATVELFGCTNTDMAGREGNLQAASHEHNRRRISFDADMEGFCVTAGDVVTLSHDLTSWAVSGRLIAGTATVLQLDRSVTFTAGLPHYLLIEFPNKFFTIKDVVNPGAVTTDTITLTSALPTVDSQGNTLYTPNTDPDHPPVDYKFSFDPRATPGKKCKIVGTDPRNMERVQLVLIDEEDGYYSSEFNAYTASAAAAGDPAPTLSGLTIAEQLFVQGSVYQVRLSLTWDVAGSYEVAQIRAGINGGALQNKGSTYGRSFEFTVPDSGTVQIEVTGFSPRGRTATESRLTATHTVVGDAFDPADVSAFSIDGDVLRWTGSGSPVKAGFALRYHHGDYRSWGDATPLYSGLVTESPYTMSPRPAGPLTIMIKEVATSGRESANAALIVTDLGDAPVANVLAIEDFHAAGYVGTITNGTVSGGNLEADTTTTFYGADDEAPLYGPDDAAALFAATGYAEMTYETPEFTPAEVLTGSTMTLDHTIAGQPFFVDYRATGPGPFYTGFDANPLFDDDAAPLFDAAPDWSPWPGAVVVLSQPYQFRARTAQGGTQGVISEFKAVIDAPDIEEIFNDLAISAGGTRLPITKPFTVISNVQLTLESDGGTAVGAKYLDKDATLGPLINCTNSANAAVAGVVDARIKGY